ncbi:hypothetical protein MTAT_19560 [Moorella thermoacetica]|uniref:Uncharacterized protein n=1 Tax=Neomoorella thermoacetica TaxID=1525 RepID=A0AAC9MUD3_NEOTH|nr:hypothetical protein [Moorella thermoacetica]AOQ24613.1 hypothetical protein Maut_02183 [Moorella thermoacetica]TYL12714.1 hypothetical protein MTAT_19560 [Moorella thermoacetica]
MIRRGLAKIEVIDNGFLLYHDYPDCTALPTYFATLDDLFVFLKERVFAEIN